MNTPRTLLAFALALVVSGLLTWSMGRTLKNRTAVAPRPLQHVVVAAEDVPAGGVFSAENVSVIDWAASQTLLGSMANREAAIGRVAIVALVSGEPVLSRELAEVGARQGISATIPRGMRAITLRGTDVGTISSLLEPGDLVDVLATYRSEGSSGSTASTVLQAARVLAVGERTSPTRERETTTAVSVTLLVGATEVGRLNLAVATGRVILAVRNGMDTAREANLPEGQAPALKVAQATLPHALEERGTKTDHTSSGAFTVETVSNGKLTSQSFEGVLP